MKNYLTFAQLDSLCRKSAGNLSDNDIYPVTRQVYINTKLMKIYGMLDGLSDPWYNKNMQLTVAADQEFLKDTATSSGIITALDASAKTITRSSGVFVAGSVVYISMSAFATGIVTHQAIVTILVGGATATYGIVAGSLTTLVGATHSVSSIVIKSMSATTADLSGYYVKDITTIYDNMYTAVPGAGTRVFDKVLDSKVFYNRELDFNALKRVAWYHQGDSILFKVGSSANALGSVYCDYRGKPALYDDATAGNIIDIPPENNQMLIDEVVASFLIEIGKPMPVEIQGKMETYQKMYEASAANQAKAMEIANK